MTGKRIMASLGWMSGLVTLAAGLSLAGCQEAQPAPDLPSRASSDFNIEIITENLEAPWAAVQIGATKYLVTQRTGELVRVADGGVTPVSGGPEDIYVDGQGGLLDIALSPDFAQSGELYLSYAYGDAAANGTALYRGALDADVLLGGTVFRAAPPRDTYNHFGSRIVVLPDETLILTSGDGFTYREHAQRLDTDLGKIMRLRPDGTPPGDNPFVNEAGAKPEIYSYGHRNVQGAWYDAPTGRLWTHEHGPRGGDELNLTEAGQNYGWPVATYGVDYNGARISPFETYPGMQEAAHVWVPSIAPSGLIIYRGDMFAEWDGDALIGALAGQSLRRVDLDGAEPVGEEVLLADLGYRFRDVEITADGGVLLVAETPDGGQLLKLTAK